jgi:hypothetical protein
LISSGRGQGKDEPQVVINCNDELKMDFLGEFLNYGLILRFHMEGFILEGFD